MKRDQDVAIVGMACVFPGAPDLKTYQRNLVDGVDAISEVPATRLDPVFFDSNSTLPDRFYCRRGGFIDGLAGFDPAHFGVMPSSVRSSEPDQLITLSVAERALADAGLDRGGFAKARTGVLIGRGNYAGAGRMRLVDYVRTAEQLVRTVRSLLPDLSEAGLQAVKHEFQSRLGVENGNAIGLVPNLTASRIAHQFDLGGPAFTIDAACASALCAVDQACQQLSTRRADVMLAGGVHLCHDEAFWSVFCQLGALSRLGQIRPFDRRADGLLIGEGVGVVVLKRLEDALASGDRIYAVIAGTGVSSDGGANSLVNPSVDGQVLALKRAWQSAGLDPSTVSLLEAHGTATPAGDRAELETLRRFFGSGVGSRAVLGSVKSMIGHAMPAAGIAGLIKVALAIHHRQLLPTLHCDEPAEAIAQTGFSVINKSELFVGSVMRGAVNAFGFGGINAHVVLEESPEARRPPRISATSTAPSDETFALFAADTVPDLLLALGRGADSRVGCVRAALLRPTPERLERLRAIVEKGRPWRGHDDIWFSETGLLTDGGKLAFVFPGVEGLAVPPTEELARLFAVPSSLSSGTDDLEQMGHAVVSLGRFYDRLLQKSAIKPTLVIGHSIGEWTAMVATQMIPEAAADSFVAGLQRGSLQVPDVAFVAAGAGVERVAPLIEGLRDVSISHDNCAHQTVLCGRAAAIESLLGRLRTEGILAQKLSFQSGFHSLLFAAHLAPHRSHIAALPLQPPTVPLWSATLCAPYPADADQVRKLFLQHLVEPVRFRPLVEKLYEGGARVFVQLGVGSPTSFIADTLNGRPHATMSLVHKGRAGRSEFLRALLALFVEGSDPDLSRFETAAAKRTSLPMMLELGVPLMAPLRPLPPQRPVADAHNAVQARFAEALADIERAGKQVADHFAASAVPTAKRSFALRRLLSVETFPEVLDHTFYRQPPGWSTLSDRHPVVPMTTSIDWMVEAVQRSLPGQVVIALEKIQASRWLALATPVAVDIRVEWDGLDRAEVSIGDYIKATARLAQSYGSAPAVRIERSAVRAVDGPALDGAHGARQMYEQRFMFHGPAFQRVVELGAVRERGIGGRIEASATPGALVDCAGQLFGYWVMRTEQRDRLAMPIGIDRISFFAPPPRTGELIDCEVAITKLDQRSVIADLELHQGGRMVARVDGWHDRRFETDDRLWPVMIFPEKNLLAEPQPGDFVFFHDRYRSAPTREQLMRRFLGEPERAAYEKQGPRNQRAWLSGRIAAKDAVRQLVWQAGDRPLFPVEIVVENDADGRPRAHYGDLDLRISIAHKDDRAVAIARIGCNVGIDVERIEKRSASFVDLAFSKREQKISGDSDEWLTRLWVCKEAIGKMRGIGLQGNPRRFEVTDRAGERLLVDGKWVETRREGDYIIGWVVE